jgi:t-SNARE complex subunit (syntaxin)
MKSKIKNSVCYNSILKKIDGIEAQITRLKKTISEMTDTFNDEDEEEVCPDVVAADKAVVEALEGMCLSMLAESEPQGDA